MNKESSWQHIYAFKRILNILYINFNLICKNNIYTVYI